MEFASIPGIIPMIVHSMISYAAAKGEIPRVLIASFNLNSEGT